MAEDSIANKNRTRSERDLLNKRREIMNLSSEGALETILGADLPARLVQSFSDEDLYFLVHDIGFADALPILALATSEQWGYILDAEIWEKDRMSLDSVTKWLNILLLADVNRTVRWLLVERYEFMEYYLSRNIEVIIREYEQDPSEIPDEFFTFDDYFYVRIINKAPDISMSDAGEFVHTEDHADVVRVIIEKLADIDHHLYQKIMTEITGVVSSEIEEECFRQRSVRLSEKGFLPFDEALEIYSPLSPSHVWEKSEKGFSETSFDEEVIPVPISHFSEIKDDNYFTDALRLIDDETELQLMQMEFASLCNQIISADQKKVKGKKWLEAVVKKACSFVSLGLEEISEGDGSPSPAEVVSLIKNYQLTNIFRAGYGLILELKWKAEKIKTEGWFRSKGLPLSFWGEGWLGVIGGLLVNRPVFFDNYKTGVLYREFATLSDVEQTKRVLDDIKGFDDLFSMLSPDTDAFNEFFMTCYNLLMTLWANHRSGREKVDYGPLSLDEFRTFFSSLWVAGERGKIKDSEKIVFLKWLSGQTAFTEIEISERLGRGLEAMFCEIENEYGTVKPEDLDPKYIHLFCVQV